MIIIIIVKYEESFLRPFGWPHQFINGYTECQALGRKFQFQTFNNTFVITDEITSSYKHYEYNNNNNKE